MTKNRPLYKCPNCGGISEVKLKKEAYKIISPVLFTVAIIFISSVLIRGELFLMGLGLLVMVFGTFYWMSSYLITLKSAKIMTRNMRWYKKIFFAIKDRFRFKLSFKFRNNNTEKKCKEERKEQEKLQDKEETEIYEKDEENKGKEENKEENKFGYEEKLKEKPCSENDFDDIFSS